MRTDGKDRRDPRDPAKLGASGRFASKTAVLDRALVLVEYLRSNCSWDQQQTARSLVPHLLEEVHEVVDAIQADDPNALRTELGDLLLNLAFQVVVSEETGGFTREDVMRDLEEKMVRRHPRVFESGEQASWETIKATERTGGALDGLAQGLDPLFKAHRIQERVASVGFDWKEPSGALEKVAEELAEVESALRETANSEDGPEALDEEIGDLLFSVVNVARLCGMHAAASLDIANKKFQERFRAVEALAKDRGVMIPGATLEEMDRLWEDVKRA